MNKLSRNLYRYYFPYFVHFLNIPKKEYCFIVSSGRTGTTFLANYLHRNFTNVKSVHEPELNINSFKFDLLKNYNSLNKTYKKFLSYRWNLYKNSKEYQIIIESNPALSTLIPMLKKGFNNPKIVYIIRNPISYVRSAYDKVPNKFMPEILFYSKEDESKRLLPFYTYDSNAEIDWENATRFEKICWYWGKINKIIYNELKNYDNVLILKFEDIFTERNSGKVKEMIDFFNIESNLNIDFRESLKFFNNKINNNKNYRLRKNFANWDKQKKELLIYHTSEMSKVFNYKYE